jgi:hypothetical protein
MLVSLYNGIECAHFSTPFNLRIEYHVVDFASESEDLETELQEPPHIEERKGATRFQSIIRNMLEHNAQTIITNTFLLERIE